MKAKYILQLLLHIKLSVAVTVSKFSKHESATSFGTVDMRIALKELRVPSKSAAGLMISEEMLYLYLN